MMESYIVNLKDCKEPKQMKKKKRIINMGEGSRRCYRAVIVQKIVQPKLALIDGIFG